jgi:predicted Ser/Thr protein kinase
MRRKTDSSTDTLLRESGYSEKAIEEIFKYYGQRRKEK